MSVLSYFLLKSPTEISNIWNSGKLPESEVWEVENVQWLLFSISNVQEHWVFAQHYLNLLKTSVVSLQPLTINAVAWNISGYSHEFIGKIPNLFLKSSLISITQVWCPLPLPLNLLKWGKCIHSQTDTDDVHNISLIWSGDILSFGIYVKQETIINRFLHFSLIRRVKFSVNLQPVKGDTAKT